MQLGRDLAQADGEAADPKRLEGVPQRLDQRPDLLDMGAEFLEAPGRGGDQRTNLRVGRHMPEIQTKPDLPAAHAVVETDRVVARIGRQRAPVARIGTGHDVQRHRRVEHGARQHALADDVGKRGVGGILRDAPVARLQPDQAGVGGRDADRAATVVAVVEGIDAGSREGRGAAGRSSRRVPEIPGTARRALQRRVGERLPAELGRRALAEKDHAGGAQTLRHGRIF